jgi:precorrin-6B C5,15-methyltransferase / cobalt-precorrin-6B C5,C15-methyltransferase
MQPLGSFLDHQMPTPPTRHVPPAHHAAVVHVLGLGQCLTDLTPLQKDRIAQADVLVAGQRVHDALSALAFPQVRARRMVLRTPLAATLNALQEEADQGRRVVVLVGGDPCCHGIGPLVVRRLGADRVSLHPGTTTVQAATALLGIALQDVRTVSLHGGKDDAGLFHALGREKWVAVYTDERSSPDYLAKILLSRCVIHHRMWVFEDLGSNSQHFADYSLEEAAERTFSALNLVLLERTQSAAVDLSLGMEDKDYIHEQGLITKRAVRATALASLHLQPEQTLWDLGAGCGSVSIEAGLLLPGGRVLAVERNARRVAMIRENIQRSHAFWVQIVAGHMPQCLQDLPEPDRIFMGGGLAQDVAVLQTATARLRPGGRLLVAAVLLGSLERARTHLRDLGWAPEIAQIQVSRSSSLAGGMRLCPENPVFLISAQKPENS